MSARKELLPGTRFGKLVVLRDLGGKPRRAECLCDCGGKSTPAVAGLRAGTSTTCGCGKRMSRYIHGKSYDLTYKTWISMWSRTTHQTNPTLVRLYQQRGITVCDEWKDFDTFVRDMGERPSKSASIDRIDNNKGYYKENCRWATALQQARNRSSNKLVTVEGITMTQVEALEKYGVSKHVLRYRVKTLGWTIEKAMLTPLRRTKRSRPKAL